MNPQPNLSSRWNPWPVSIIVFFTFAFIGCGTFVAYCTRHPADLVAADYYEQEMRYQAQMDGIQHAHQGVHLATVNYDPASRRITIALPPNHSRTNATGMVQLYRPSAISLDRQVKLEPNANGVQTIDAGSLLPGLWKVRVSWTTEQQNFFLDEKIIIK